MVKSDLLTLNTLINFEKNQGFAYTVACYECGKKLPVNNDELVRVFACRHAYHRQCNRATNCKICKKEAGINSKYKIFLLKISFYKINFIIKNFFKLSTTVEELVH
jgi:hypothetical protein